MTEPSSANRQAERLARLQQRSSNTSADQSGGRRKQKAGRSSKIAIVGASTTAMLGLVATYAYVNLPNAAGVLAATEDQAVTGATVQQVTLTPAEADTSTDPLAEATVPSYVESVIVIDGNGTLLSAPADLDPAIVQMALDDYRASHPTALQPTAAAKPAPAPTATAAPVPKSVDLAVPAPPPAPKRSAASTARRSNGGGGATAQAPAPSRSQSKSKGS